MISIIELEKCVAGASIFDIIIGKLCTKKKPCPIVLFDIDKSSKVGFYYAVLLFSLAIYLKKKGD